MLLVGAAVKELFSIREKNLIRKNQKTMLLAFKEDTRLPSGGGPRRGKRGGARIKKNPLRPPLGEELRPELLIRKRGIQ